MAVKCITDEMLRRYMPAAEERWIQVIETSAKQNERHIYSEAFHETLEEQIRRAKRVEPIQGLLRIARKTACILLLFAAVAFAGCMSVKATRAIFIDLIQRVYSDCTDYIYELKEGASKEFHLVESDYIPEGYKESGRAKLHDHGIEIYYTTEDGSKQISYLQDVADGLTVSLNTEGATVRKTDIDGIDVEYFTNMGDGFVYWTEGNCYYELIGSPDVGELLKMAESVIEKEKD